MVTMPLSFAVVHRETLSFLSLPMRLHNNTFFIQLPVPVLI